MGLTREDIREIKQTPEYREAFDIALAIHRREHNIDATHFRDCEECKCGFALLLGAGFERLLLKMKEQ
jgi:hypothetical protein